MFRSAGAACKHGFRRHRRSSCNPENSGVEGLEKVAFNVFRPVKLMLAQTAETVKEALDAQGCKTAFEYKYDGARVQIHKQNGSVEFSAED